MENNPLFIQLDNMLVKKNVLNKITKGEYWKANWNQELYLQYIDRENQPYTSRILAIYFRAKNYTFENYEQVSHAFSRSIACAKRLSPYSLERINRVCKYLNKNADYKWALETVEKYILEDIEELAEDKPILTLTNGEKIYDIKRLQQLEQSNDIYWTGVKWKQKS